MCEMVEITAHPTYNIKPVFRRRLLKLVELNKVEQIEVELEGHSVERITPPRNA